MLLALDLEPDAQIAARVGVGRTAPSASARFVAQYLPAVLGNTEIAVAGETRE